LLSRKSKQTPPLCPKGDGQGWRLVWHKLLFEAGSIIVHQQFLFSFYWQTIADNGT